MGELWGYTVLQRGSSTEFKKIGELPLTPSHAGKDAELWKGQIFKYVSVGDGFVIAVTCTGQLVGWGMDDYGQSSKFPVLGKGETFVQVSAGSNYAIALTSNGRLLSWGLDDCGQCSKIPALGRDEAFTQVSAGYNHAAALTSTRRVVIWGSDDCGKCSNRRPLGEDFIQVSAGGNNTAALTSTGRLLVWGRNGHGQRNDVPVLRDKEVFRQVSAGESHLAAVTSLGRLLAWGRKDYGQCKELPELAEGNTFVEVSAGGIHTYALTLTGRLFAWGSDDHGQCRTPALDERETFCQVSVGRENTAALTSTGRLLVWGRDNYEHCSSARCDFHSSTWASHAKHPEISPDVLGREFGLSIDSTPRDMFYDKVQHLDPDVMVLHVAAAAGDLATCKFAIECGAVAGRKDRNGRTAMDLALQNGHTDVASYLGQFNMIAAMRGGSGNALDAALADVRLVETMKWYTIQMNIDAERFGIKHSILAVTVGSGGDKCTYTIEKALIDDADMDHERFKNGIFVSDWLEVIMLSCFENDTPYKTLARDDLSSKGASMTMSDLYRTALEMGPYDVGRCNCHHLALQLYNACAKDGAKVDHMPNENWTKAARILSAFVDVNWMHSCPARMLNIDNEATSDGILAGSQKASLFCRRGSRKASAVSVSSSNVSTVASTAAVTAASNQVQVALDDFAESDNRVLGDGANIFEVAANIAEAIPDVSEADAKEHVQQVEDMLAHFLGDDYAVPVIDWMEAFAEEMPLIKQVAGVVKLVHSKYKARVKVQSKLVELLKELEQIDGISESIDHKEVRGIIVEGLQRAREDLKSIVKARQVLMFEDCVATVDSVVSNLQHIYSKCTFIIVASGSGDVRPARKQSCCPCLPL